MPYPVDRSRPPAPQERSLRNRRCRKRIIVSAASVWEISIKRASGKLACRHDFLEVLARTGFESLAIAPRHADLAESLPLHHTDPFDRLLIAQAKIEGLVLVTQYRHISPYGVPILGGT
jgi:PIN domain nuclease of toxin-antitoxin system